jgi:hypothetical protein
MRHGRAANRQEACVRYCPCEFNQAKQIAAAISRTNVTQFVQSGLFSRRHHCTSSAAFRCDHLPLVSLPYFGSWTAGLAWRGRTAQQKALENDAFSRA